MSNLDLTKIERYYSLFLLYKNLLTAKQQEYFHQYVFKNHSLQEIAKLLGVSRNAVYDSLIKTIKILDDYEVKLQLFKKYQARKSIYDQHKEEQFVLKLQEIDKI
ncbi:MAG: DNA-binding protein [Spiroplasma sp.]|nr:DNA-binding protein [Spiroplasma sp.]